MLYLGNKRVKLYIGNKRYNVISPSGEIIPNGYTLCEYLESTGNQYIDEEYQIGNQGIIYGDTNLIPCLDRYKVPCFYDRIKKVAVYNKGEGEFLYKLKDTTIPAHQTYLGFPSSTNSTVGTNSTYPYTYYFNDVLVEFGKTYKITFTNKRTPSSNDDGTPRFRLINVDGTFYGSVGQNTASTFWDIKSIIYDGNWYGCKEIVFTPKYKTHKLRILLLVGTNNNCPPNFYLQEIKEVQ